MHKWSYRLLEWNYGRKLKYSEIVKMWSNHSQIERDCEEFFPLTAGTELE